MVVLMVEKKVETMAAWMVSLWVVLMDALMAEKKVATMADEMAVLKAETMVALRVAWSVDGKVESTVALWDI